MRGAGPFTPKALHNKARGRERSERTLGWRGKQNLNPEGVAQSPIGREYLMATVVEPFQGSSNLYKPFPRVARLRR